MITVSRKAHFNSAHRLYREDWDDAQNLKVFGKCSYPNYHGHNYNLVVSVTGEINPETGFVINLKDLSDIIKQHVEEKLDHKNLNLDVPEFKGLIPTAENIAVVIWNILREKIDKKLLLKIVLYETERNFVEYSGA